MMFMERIEAINPGRIEWCCFDAGITVEQLAAATKIAPATLERVMAGESGLTYGQLSKVADYFGRGVLFFLEPDPVDDARVYTPQFRTLKNQKPLVSTKVRKLIERVERQRDVFVRLREDLGDESWPRFEPPNWQNLTPAVAAARARQWLGLTTQNSFEAHRAAVEARGILVFRTNGYAGKWQIEKANPVLGFCIYDARCPVIVVKKQDALSRQSFTLFHELGHLLLQRASSIDEENDFAAPVGNEPAANAFAGRVLVPDAVLATVHDADRPAEVSEYDAWLSAQRLATGASTDVLLIRLIGEGRLPQARYDEYQHWRSEQQPPPPVSPPRKYRYREPKNVFGDSFVRAVFGALTERYITLPRASTYLDDLKITDLRRLEHEYVGL